MMFLLGSQSTRYQKPQMGNSNPTKNLEFQIFISSIVSDVKKSRNSAVRLLVKSEQKWGGIARKLLWPSRMMLVANTALKFIVNFTKNVNSDVRCFYVQQFWRTHTVGYYYIFENELRRLWLTKSVVAPIISTWSGRHFRWCFFWIS